MNTAEYCQSNLLVIPQALDDLQDLSIIAKSDGSSIYYKSLARDLVDIEFYTNQPCLLYIEQGEEELTTWQNHRVKIKAGDCVFLHQGQNLHSDFVKTSKDLRAWMVFFDRSMIQHYLDQKRASSDVTSPSQKTSLTSINVIEDKAIQLFFEQMLAYQNLGVAIDRLLATKLTELVILLENKLGDALVSLLMKGEESLPARRNLQRLLNSEEVLSLSVNDLARISGRSSSSFLRDFKRSFGTSPKQWLFEKRMAFAKKLVGKQELSVTDIAISVGYNNVSHFIQSYKNKFGITPKQDGLVI